MSSTRGSFAESRQKTRTWPGGRRASAGQTRAASAALVKPGLPPKKRKSALVATSEVRGRGTVVLKKRESERRVGTPSPSGFFSRGVFSLSAWAHRCLLSISTGGSLEMTKTGKGEKYLKQAFITDKVDGHRPQAWASKRKKAVTQVWWARAYWEGGKVDSKIGSWLWCATSSRRICLCPTAGLP